MEKIRTPADITRYHAERRGEQPAIVFEGEPLSYSTLDRRANRVANGLIHCGLSPQDRIGFLDKNSLSFFEIFFGALKAGGVLVGINFRLAGPEVSYIVNDAGLEILFVGRESYALIEEIEPQLSKVRAIVAIDGGHARWPDLQSWRAEYSRGDPGIEIPLDNDVLQLYTSGTTGHPKGAYSSNRAWMHFSDAVMRTWGRFEPGESQLICMPLCHIAGISSSLLGLMQGTRNIVTREVDTAQILRLIPEYRISRTLFAPVIIQGLLAEPGVDSADFTSLRCITYGASPISESVLEPARALFGCDFVHLYGLTENFGAGTFLPAEDHDVSKGKLRSCGKPYPGAQLRIVDGQGNDRGVGDVGEIALKSPWLMTGYWNNPDATASAIVDGWLHTGDAGYLDGEGYLYIHDRIKDMIVSGGENVYPAEVENVLSAHPAVADVAVIGVPDEKWGEAVKAIVVVQADHELDAQQLIAFARDRIAGFKLPKSVDTIEALPRNASGKVLRRELRAKYWEGKDRQVG